MVLIITILPVVTKDLPISPRFTPYNFLSRCKFSTLTTRQPSQSWLNFTYSRSHAFRYERKNTNPTLVRIELTTSALAGVQVTYYTTRATTIGKRQEADTQDSQLMKAVRRENTRFRRACNDAYERFLERHVQGMEEDLRQRNQRGLIQRCKSLKIEDTWKVNSQYIRDEEGIMLRDPGFLLGRRARFFGTLFNSKSDKLRLDIIEELPQWPITHALVVEPTENELIGALSLTANKCEGSETKRTPC